MLACAVNGTAAEGQYWGRAGVSLGAAGSTFGLRLESRTEEDVSDDHYASLALGVERSVMEYLKVGLNYARVDKRGAAGWETEHRPYVDAEVRWSPSRLGIQDRSRLEVRLRDGDRALRYRNRLKLTHPLGGTGLSASVDDEVFVDLEVSELNRNRLTSSVQMRLGSGVSLGVFHAFEHSRTSESWTGLHAVGASLSYSMNVEGRSSK